MVGIPPSQKTGSVQAADVRPGEFCATLLLRPCHRDYGVSFHTVPAP